MKKRFRACRKAKKEVKMLSSISVIFFASVSKRFLIALISLYIFTECLSFQHTQLLDKHHWIYKFEKHVRSDLRVLRQSTPNFYHNEFATNITFKRVVVKRVDGKIVYKLVHSKEPSLFIKYDCFTSICLEGGTILFSSWPPKFSQKTNLQPDVTALIFFELTSPPGGGNMIKKYLPVVVRLSSLQKKKHGKVEWDILSTQDRKLTNCSGFQSFQFVPTSCKNAFPKSTRRLKLHQQDHFDERTIQNHAHKNKNSHEGKNKEESSSSSFSTTEQLSSLVVLSENKSDNTIQFFRPLEIRLICPPFSGSIAENNKCVCPKGKVNILEKCVSAKKARADGYPKSSFQTEVLPIVPSRDNSIPLVFVTKYICPDYTKAKVDGKKCVCSEGHVMKKRVCVPIQETPPSTTGDRLINSHISQQYENDKVKAEGKTVKESSRKSYKRHHNNQKNTIVAEMNKLASYRARRFDD